MDAQFKQWQQRKVEARQNFGASSQSYRLKAEKELHQHPGDILSLQAICSLQLSPSQGRHCHSDFLSNLAYNWLKSPDLGASFMSHTEPCQ